MISEFNFLITKASNSKHIEKFCKDNGIHGVMFYGRGSAKKCIWELLGFTDNAKIARLKKRL